MRYRTALSTSERAAPGLRERHIRGVMDATQDSYSASTRRNYAGAWRLFARWAGREGFSALPAKPETVAAYLAERAADGLSPASLRMDRAAIRHHHSEAGHANPADNEGVRRVMRGLTRRAAYEGRTPKQAAALTARALEAIRATAHLPRTGPGGRTEGARTARRRGRVDVALVSVMRDAMLRRSEAGPLTWDDVEFWSRRVRQGSRCAARRATRTATGPPCTWAGPPRRSCGRSTARTLPPEPPSSACGPDGPCPAGSPRRRGPRGWSAASRGTRRASAWRATWWPWVPESPPSRSPDAGHPPRCPPTMPAPNWPRTVRSLISTARSDQFSIGPEHSPVYG